MTPAKAKEVLDYVRATCEPAKPPISLGALQEILSAADRLSVLMRDAIGADYRLRIIMHGTCVLDR